jgi:hypothetical protein
MTTSSDAVSVSSNVDCFNIFFLSEMDKLDLPDYTITALIYEYID